MRQSLSRATPWLYAAAVALQPAVAFAKKGSAVATEEPLPAKAVQSVTNSESFTSRPLILILALAALSLVPFVLMMVTSFVKISVVLSIVRSALGTQQIPPTQVITGLAIILTVYIMAPIGQNM